MHFLSVAILVVTAPLVACSPASVHILDSVSVFSAALSSTTANVRDGFAAVREAEGLGVRSQLATLVLCREPSCPPVETTARDRPKVTARVFDRLFLLLGALAGYGEMLQAMAGGETEVKASAYAAASGRQLNTALDAVDALSPTDVTDFSRDVMTSAAKSARSLGSFLEQEAVSNDLPATVAAMHPHIEALALYLINAIGSSTPVPEPGAADRQTHGLRGILVRQQQRIENASARFLNSLRQDRKISDAELVKLTFRTYDHGVGRIIRTDFALAETQFLLRQMVEAHAALRNPAAPATLAAVQTFRFLAQRTTAAFANLEMEQR